MVLGIMMLAAGIVIPSAAAALDRIVVHAVFFDFQRQLLQARGRAFRAQQSLVLYDAGPGRGADDVASGSPRELPVTLDLRAGWTFGLSTPIRITAGGRCSQSEVTLIKARRVAAVLSTSDAACHLLRRS